MHNVGPLLKGQDFREVNEIDKRDFYYTIQSFPEFVDGPSGMRENDITDLIELFDEGKNNYLDLNLIKDRIDGFIGSGNIHLYLDLTTKV
jgi:hypothetical protein